MVCLCLLKLGLEQGPRRRDSLECAQALCSQLCQQAQETAAGLGQHRLPPEHTIRRGPRDRRSCRDRGPFCVDTTILSSLGLQYEALTYLDQVGKSNRKVGFFSVDQQSVFQKELKHAVFEAASIGSEYWC